MNRSRASGGLLAAVAALAAFALLPAASASQRADTITVSMLAYVNQQPAYNVLIPNFERVYPDIKIVATYTATPQILSQLETTELAAGNAPDLLTVQPACGTPTSVCILAKAGYLAPLVAKAWTKRSVPLVTSADKYGAGLFAFSPQIAPYGVFTNDALFKKLRLKVPETFSQLLAVCRQAKANGTSALVAGGDGSSFSRIAQALAASTVYGANPRWTTQLKGGHATFEGTPGWHQALQELADMNGASCFQPGIVGTTNAVAIAEFAQGQGLMQPNTSSQKGLLDTADPQFGYSFHPFPAGTAPGEAVTAINLNMSVAVNSHASAQGQAAAQRFIDFLARPKQTALYAQIAGGITQYEFLKGQIAPFMASMGPVFAQHRYIVLPELTWWNAAVNQQGLQQAQGLLTGQRSIDDVLNAMDAAWKQGPA